MKCWGNKWDCKKEEVEGNFEWVTLTEAKLKGNGEVLWCGVNGIILDVLTKGEWFKNDLTRL